MLTYVGRWLKFAKRRYRSMSLYEAVYLKQNKLLMTFFGIWTYQSKLQKQINSLVFGISAVSLIIPMAEGLTNDTSTDIVTFFETIVAIFLVFGGFAQTMMLQARQYAVRDLFEHIANDCRDITDGKELEILQNFSRQGKTLIMLFMVCSIGWYLSFTILTYIPLLIDESASKDYSKIFPYYASRWIICHQARNIQVIFHSVTVIFYGGVAYILVIGIYVVSIKHTCGLYAIVSYRLQCLVKTGGVVNVRDIKNDGDIVSKLIRIMCKHREAFKRVQMISKIFNRTFFLVEICLLLCLALLIFDVKYNINHIRLMFRILFITVMFILHAFYMNYCGEQIIRYSNGVNSAAYSIKWYLLSVRARKILFMILVRTSKPDMLNAGIMTLSLENFGSIIKSSWSLATVLLTTQKTRRG